MKLPQSFLDNMKLLLGEEYEAWLLAMDGSSFQGLRINTGKLDKGIWESIRPFQGEPVPWTENGFYYDADKRPARDPYYHAGLYYLQEPSAMAPAAILPVKPGDRVLDLCAAPGGKSTELGARLKGKGLLVSNDISNSRARALLKNLELFGISNICVTSEAPKKLADTFGAFFDRILVDAPCSGEGMFRKDPDLVKSWMERGPEMYAPLQREILSEAVRMLRPGGYLLYSTCTFSPVEDEENISWLLEQEPDMELMEIPLWQGACRGIDGTPVIRLFPHKLQGEGHFAALLHKQETDHDKRSYRQSVPAITEKKMKKGKAARQTAGSRGASDMACLLEESDYPEWERLLKCPPDRGRMMVKDGQVYVLPEIFDHSWNLRYLRTGLLLGEWKKNRFEPSQAAAMALTADGFLQTFSMAREDERVIRYLKGETIFLTEQESLPKGWILVCVDGFPLGWAKYTGTMLKNKYYTGWRWQ